MPMNLTEHDSFNMLLIVFFCCFFLSRINFSVNVDSLCCFSMLCIYYFKRFLNIFIRKSTEYHSLVVLLIRSLIGGFYFKGAHAEF